MKQSFWKYLNKNLNENLKVAVVTFIVFSSILFLKSLDTYTALFDPFDDSFLSFDLYDVYFSKLFDKKGFQDSEIILINIQDLEREEISILVDTLSLHSPKVIGIDVIFKNLDYQKDSIFISRLNKHKNKLVLGFDLTKSPNTVISNFNHGYINLVSEDKYTVRSYNRSTTDKIHGAKKAFSTVIYDVSKGNKSVIYSQISNEPEVIDFSRCCVNVDYKKSYIVYTAEEILKTKSWKQKIKNRIILLGYIAKGPEDNLDKYYTPMNPSILGRSAPDMNGIQIHANILSSRISKNTITKVNRTFLLILSMIFSFFYIKFMLLLKTIKPNQWELIFRVINYLLLIMLFGFALTLFHLFRIRIEIDIFLIPLLLLKEIYSFIFSDLRGLINTN